jgi:hypothetical protein
LNSFSLLHFPKTSLKRTSCRQCLPEFVAPGDVHKLKTRKSISQKLEIAGSRVTESASCAQAAKKIFKVPTHQFKAEDFIGGRFRADDVAHIPSIILSRIETVLRTVIPFEFLQKKLLRSACLARSMQAVGQQIAARTRNCADHVTATRMAQVMKRTSHRKILYIEIPHVQRVVLDELAARFDDVAHKNSEHFVGIDGVVVV